MWFTPDNLNLAPNKNDEYNCSSLILTMATNFTHLMKLVLLTRESPEAFEMLKQMLKTINTEDLNAKNSKGWTALMLAARNSNTKSTVETVKLLIEAGANLNVQSNMGWTALIYAVIYVNTDSNIETIKLLINAKANLDIQDNDGWTALTYVARKLNTDSDIETIKLLVSGGANSALKTRSNKTACGIIAEKNIKHLSLLKLLCGAELHYILTH